MNCASNYEDIVDSDDGDEHSLNYKVTSCDWLKKNHTVAGSCSDTYQNTQLQLKS
jgi:hypothetical protein